jgi:hypothetical protein
MATLTASWIVRCLKRDLCSTKQAIQYAEDVAACQGEDAHLYAEAAKILRGEGEGKA